MLTQPGELFRSQRNLSEMEVLEWLFWEVASLICEHLESLLVLLPHTLPSQSNQHASLYSQPWKNTYWFGGQDLGQSCLGISVFMDRTSPSLISEKHLNDNKREAQDNLINSFRSLQPPSPHVTAYSMTLDSTRAQHTGHPLSYLCLYILFFNSITYIHDFLVIIVKMLVKLICLTFHNTCKSKTQI